MHCDQQLLLLYKHSYSITAAAAATTVTVTTVTAWFNIQPSQQIIVGFSWTLTTTRAPPAQNGGQTRAAIRNMAAWTWGHTPLVAPT